MQISLKTICLSLFIFFIYYKGHAQHVATIDSTLLKSVKKLEDKKNYNEAVDLLKTQLSIDLNAKEKATVLSKMGSLYYKSKDYQSSKLYYLEATLKDTSSTSLIKNYIGISYCYKKINIRDSSIYFANKAYYKNKALTRSKNQIDTEYKIAFIYSHYNLYEKALSLLLSSSDGFKLLNDKKKLASSYNKIAFINRMEGNIKTALTYYHKARYLKQELKDHKGLSLVYNNLGNAYKTLMQLDSAKHYYISSLKLKREYNYKNQGFTLHNLGTTFYLKGDLTNSKTYYKNALIAKKKENDTITLIYSYNELALVAIDLRELTLGAKYLDSSKAYINMPNESTLRWYELKNKLHYKKGEYLKAYNYQESYINLYKDLFNTTKSKTIIDNQEKYDTQKKTKKIENLTEENALTTKVLNQRTLYLIATIVLLLIVSIIYFINKQQQKLAAQKEDIRNLRKLFNSQDIVRNKIGRDLHDIVKSKYEGIRLMIISLSRSENLKNDIKEITQEIADANGQVRMLSHRLSPLDQRIQHSELNQIIRAELNKFQLYTNIDVSITEVFPKAWDAMRLDAQNHLYGIFLEAIQNVKDHSNASEIIITSTINENVSLITISDNGIGKGEPFKEGIGIGNMKSRAKLMDGNLSIKPSVSGFSITLKFPLNVNTDEKV